MKKCQTCGQDNADTMRFCVECGSTLPDAPIIVNFGGGTGAGQPNPFGNAPQQSNPFGDATQQQQAGGKGNFGNFPNQFSNVPPPRKSNKKTFLIIGGILALFLLVFAAGAAVIGYNMLIKDEVAVNPTPTSASPSPTASTKSSSSPKSPTPTVSASPEDSPTTNSSGASADVDRVWVDYNVTQKGKKGMRIHVKFTVHKMKGVDSFLAIYFEKADGEKLLTNNKEYRSKDGQVATFQSLAPAYPDTVYEDEQLFIPYTEFSLDSGKYNLKMDIDVIYENGDLVQHLKYQEFEYTEP